MSGKPPTPGEGTANKSGGYRGSGRGNWRGRGRGDSRRDRPAKHGGGSTQDGAQEDPSAPVREKYESKPPLTHFLALPLGHHADLRERVSAFTRSLLDSAPAIPGLDESVVISPRRLHITLGVMSLSDALPDALPSRSGPASTQAGESASGTPRTVAAALALLRELRPRVQALLAGAPLRVALRHVDIMRPDRGDPERAHVMWAGPSLDSEDARHLKRVAEFVNGEFRKAGLVVNERRPLKLHCTILNTVYRRPKPRGPRVPFSYTAVLSSPAFEAIKVQNQGVAAEATVKEADISVPELTEAAAEVSVTAMQRRNDRRKSVEVGLGEYTIDEIQVCKMGSWGPEGEYVCVGSIALD
ncbi:uncharacterized protein PHACADRAFT_191520 [Phanerochaete carnosa HHB-10118-sp]|uniref:A-kinase anchor protein 7-like phosphoesterase domain-containing protein n=1 Tax=Phanerochaete carnosa (strain HHB-10118-sp) TaxID=650164 RepID=K5WJ96_PHACS|nr:uncharacterized protein PHACADRAFT_191520 [Phanerochaete carnosa HHB-10118-sp]EKM59199.1 hypothetical protein PHACADRAFT_191520 [Phanerochaete carnosa HHB-10118-sp]